MTTIKNYAKGWPVEAADLSLGEIRDRRWSVLNGDMPMPCAVLKRRALENNAAMIAAFRRTQGVETCPHGKTTMSPELMLQQVRDGAWGITAANVRQLLVMWNAGVRRVLIANQVAGIGEIRSLAHVLTTDPSFEVFVLADSEEGVAHLDEHLSLPPGRRLEILLEMGSFGGRTGARTLEAGLATALAVSRSRNLSLRGVECFEGILHGESDDEIEAKIRSLYALVGEAARACAERKLFAPGPVILSGGGSAYFDMAAFGLADAGLDAPATVVIRSGCYITHDFSWLAKSHDRMAHRSPKMMRDLPEPQPALEVWAAIQSIPEPGLAIATAGKRDVSFDMELPIPVAWSRAGAPGPRPLADHSVKGLNDQHAYIVLPQDSPLKVGDLVCLGISHPCTTFDKWRKIAVVDDDYTVVDAVTTEF